MRSTPGRPLSGLTPAGRGSSAKASMASPTRRLTGLSRARNAFRARGRNSIRYGTAGLQPRLGPNLLPRYGLTRLGERLTGRPRVGEVLQQFAELLGRQALQPRGDLSRDDRGEPLPVLGQVHDLAAGSIMRSAGYPGSFIER